MFVTISIPYDMPIGTRVLQSFMGVLGYTF